MVYKFSLDASERHFEKQIQRIVQKAVTRFPCYCSLGIDFKLTLLEVREKVDQRLELVHFFLTPPPGNALFIFLTWVIL